MDLDCYAIQMFTRRHFGHRLVASDIYWEVTSIQQLINAGFGSGISVALREGSLLKIYYYNDQQAHLLFANEEGARTFITKVDARSDEPVVVNGIVIEDPCDDPALDPYALTW